MRDLESRIRAVVRHRTPKGWKLREKAYLEAHGKGYAYEAIIECPPIKDRNSLGIFLHEVAHVELNHHAQDLPEWREEYEADQWAIKAMRAEGIAVPIEFSADSRHSVRCHCEKALAKDPDCEIDEEVLRFAFPDNWRVIAEGEPLKKAA